MTPQYDILINATNLVGGGALQVADSICCSLNQFKEFKFIVVLSKHLIHTLHKIEKYDNVATFTYTLPKNVSVMLCGRDRFLDNLVVERKVDAVLTIFGPSYWVPRCKHLMGYARPHYIMPESPFFKRLSFREALRYKIQGTLLMYYFKKCSKHLYTENPYITKLLQEKLPQSHISTITNYYNQIYDNPTEWVDYKLPDFDGVTIFAVSVFYPHKNFRISIDIAQLLKDHYPNFKFRFVFAGGTKEQFGPIPTELEHNFTFTGRVSLTQCPSLYKQADIMFMPTLLECFTATYPEAMVMGVPIVTVDLPFARGLCGDAALYYSPLNAEEATERIYNLGADIELQKKLINAGKEQLKVYDTYNERTQKLINILKSI